LLISTSVFDHQPGAGLIIVIPPRVGPRPPAWRSFRAFVFPGWLTQANDQSRIKSKLEEGRIGKIAAMTFPEASEIIP
jgi:hypothetical protein